MRVMEIIFDCMAGVEVFSLEGPTPATSGGSSRYFRNRFG
jgi:hypothetical protein